MILERNGEHLGTVGEKTNYRTVHGEDIHVGDIVKAGIMGGLITVVEPMVKGDNGLGEEKAFVMGIEMTCNDAEGTVEGAKILEIVKPYTALELGEKLGRCDVVVSDKEIEKEKTTKDAGEELAYKIFFGIIDKAIKDLKEANKDYHGLEFIKTVLTEGGLR